jgi:hypothetical protein
VVKGPLTRNLGRVFARVRDELVHAFDEVLPLPAKGASPPSTPLPSYSPAAHRLRAQIGWNLVQIHPVSLQVVARASNRVFVDLPVCKSLRLSPFLARATSH